MNCPPDLGDDDPGPDDWFASVFPPRPDPTQDTPRVASIVEQAQATGSVPLDDLRYVLDQWRTLDEQYTYLTLITTALCEFAREDDHENMLGFVEVLDCALVDAGHLVEDARIVTKVRFPHADTVVLHGEEPHG